MIKKAALIFTVALFAVACNDDTDPDNTPDGGSDGGSLPDDCTIVEIVDDITTNTTWTDGNVYVIRAWDFYVEATLTVEPGVVVKFHPSDGPYLMVGDGGTIVAEGTAAKPIIWTSYKDDSHCGDTNGDEAATSPAATDWHTLDTNGEDGSSFVYNEFYYGGGGSYRTSLNLSALSSASVQNCTFAHGDGGKVGDFYYGTLSANESPATTVINDNVFFDNNLPLSISTLFCLDASNTFSDPADANVANTMNGIFVENTTDYIISAISWDETEVAYVINDNDFWIEEDGGSLTLADDVVVKFTADGEIVYDGANINNHDGAGVAFTSFRDDTLKGDTNGDEAATGPSDGDWGGICDNSVPVGDDCHETWTNIYYDSY